MEIFDVQSRPVAPPTSGTLAVASAGGDAAAFRSDLYPGVRRYLALRVAAEWRRLALVVSATLLLVELPYLVAFAHTTDERVFVSIWAPHDYAQYAAAMREGATGPSWLIHDHLSGEPHDPILMYTLYVAIGKLAGALGADFERAYHLAEIGARAVLLVAIYAFCRAILPNARDCRRGLVLIVFSSGLAPMAVAARLVGAELGFTPAELNWPEVNTFLVFFTAPHLVLGLALLLLAARSYLASWSSPSAGAPVAVAAAMVGLGLTNPFSLVTLCAVVPAHLLLMRGLGWGIPRGALLSAAAVALVAVPFVAYNGLVFRVDPFWSAGYGRQNLQPSPPLASLALGLGALLALALIGLPALVRRCTVVSWLVVVWIGLSLGLMYAPIDVQRRFAYGLHPMVGVVAAFGLDPIWAWIRRQRRGPAALVRPILTVLLVQALVGSAAILFLFAVQEARDPGGRALREGLEAPGATALGTFQPASLREAGRWLAIVMQPDDVLLAENASGNYLAGLVPGRVYVGHWVATPDFGHKHGAAREFYRGENGDERRRTFLAANRIRYVLYGPYERAIGSVPPTAAQLRSVYANHEVTIFEVASR